MSLYHVSGLGLVHLNEAKPGRVIPGPERHKWDNKPSWGESATCKKCGCIKRRLKPEYAETYQMPGQKQTTERPSCQPTETSNKP